MEASGLVMEMGMLNICMATVAARAQHGDATLRDGEAVMEWFTRSNASMPEVYARTLEMGKTLPLNRDGIDSAYMGEVWTNFNELDEARRNHGFNGMTDAGGNTLRSLHEGLLCVCAGGVRNGTASMKDARRVWEAAEAEGIEPDVDMYNAMLMVMAGAAVHGEVGMEEAGMLVEEMRDRGKP